MKGNTEGGDRKSYVRVDPGESGLPTPAQRMEDTGECSEVVNKMRN